MKTTNILGKRSNKRETKINLLGLAIKLRKLEFRCGGRVGDGDIKLEVEFILEEVVDIPAFAGPPCSFRIGGGDPKPIVIVRFVHLGVGY